jgi:hypothetical protein
MEFAWRSYGDTAGSSATRWWPALARCRSCAPQGQKDKQNGTILRVARTLKRNTAGGPLPRASVIPGGRQERLQD